MSNRISRRALLGAAAGLAAGLASAPALAAPTSPDPSPGPPDLWLGSAGRRVDVVEYGSLDCPHCADFALRSLPSIRSAYVDTGAVRYAFRDLPLHKPALRASLALRAATDGAQRVDLAAFLFARRDDWMGTGDVDAVLRRYLVAAGLDEAHATALLADDAQRTSVLASRSRGVALGVATTPTFFVNGTRVDGDVGAQGLAAAIVAAAGH